MKGPQPPGRSVPRRAAGLGVLALSLLVGSSSSVQLAPVPVAGPLQDEELPLELRVPRMEGPEAQLAHARRLKARAFRASDDDSRAFWRSLAVEGYRAVRAFHPEAPALGAEAAFRAGELLRAEDRVEAAREEFSIAVEKGAGTAFRARGRLELGHVARRAGHLRTALDRYLEVCSDADADPLHREDAWLWAGRVWRLRGAWAEARRAWEGVIERSADPFLVLRAHDELALAYVEEDDVAAAAGQLERCRVDLQPILLEETARGERLLGAYRRMRARDALRRAIEARRSNVPRGGFDSSASADRPRNA